MYEPQEDSFLLAQSVKSHARGCVLDMGTGTGIQAITAAQCSRVKKIIAIDLDKHALTYAKKHNTHKKITYLTSNLFSKLSRKKYTCTFDTIIFNPPYLPQEGKEKAIALEGGKQGNEIIARFLTHARTYLKPHGTILLVCSSLTPKMQTLFEQNLFTPTLLNKQHMFFEDIFIYQLSNDPRLLELQQKKVRAIHYFAQGKRGLILTGIYRSKKVAIKIVRQASTSPGTIALEARVLKEVNKHHIGPHYLFHTKNTLIYQFVEGKHLRDLVQSPKINKLCTNILKQCHTLDQLHINKQEMTRPTKNILVKGTRVTLIDFERSRKTNKPSNVTQFCQFIMKHVQQDNAWITLAQAYSAGSPNAFKKMLEKLS